MEVAKARMKSISSSSIFVVMRIFQGITVGGCFGEERVGRRVGRRVEVALPFWHHHSQCTVTIDCKKYVAMGRTPFGTNDDGITSSYDAVTAAYGLQDTHCASSWVS